MSEDKFPIYTMEEVAVHDSKQRCIWVTYLNGVYDVTNYVDKHPGGKILMVSAGSSMDQQFMLYPLHKQEKILTNMEIFRIGTLAPEDVEKNLKQIYDPYKNEPPASKDLNVLASNPLYAGPPIDKLVKNFVTPTSMLFVRSHLPVPLIDVDTYEVVVCGIGVQERRYKLSDLKEQFSKCSVTMAMQCAGNRRYQMNKVRPVKGRIWDDSAMHNAVWSGVLLYDLLRDCGFSDKSEGLHIQFEGMDLDGSKTPYGASIPVEKIDPLYKVIVAYEVNNEPIPPHNGFPVRMIIPGVSGVRSVKWLGRIIVSDQESQTLFQQMEYKGYSPSVRWNTVDHDSAPAIQEMPVVSVICNIKDGQNVKATHGGLLVKGYAYSGGGRKIIRVDVTADGGENWKTATLIQDRDTASLIRCWTWTLWQVHVPIKANRELEICAKAVDSSYNSQPESFENIWNYAGFICNAYHRVKINVT